MKDERSVTEGEMWNRVYMRYVLAMVMFGYGLAKLIPVQMPFPTAEDLLTPLSKTGRFSVLWNFMGMAPGYMILTGASEILGSLLLVNRRTMVYCYCVCGEGHFAFPGNGYVAMEAFAAVERQ